jgi:hypothetical protein
MTWFKVDDNLAFHSKIMLVGNEAMGVWVRAGSWVSQQLTDGFVPASIVAVLGGLDAAERLVEVGLWLPEEGGWRFNDWADYQPTKAEIESTRKRERERKANYRRGTDGRYVPVGQPQGLRAESHGVSPDLSHQPVPSRPVPSIEPKGSIGVAAAKRGNRIADPFLVTVEMREWAAGRVPGVDVNKSTEVFVNYWRAKAGKEAIKIDWIATWRNWLIRDHEKLVNEGGSRQPERKTAARKNYDALADWNPEAEQKELTR